MDNLFEFGDILNFPFEAFTGQWSSIKPHWHYFTEVIYVVSGQMMTETQTAKYVSHPGDFIIIKPKLIHSFESLPYKGKDFFCYCIKFDATLLRSTIPGTPQLSKILDAASMSEDVSLTFKKNQIKGIPMERYFKTCIKEVHERKFGYDTKVSSVLGLMLTEIARLWQSQGLNLYAPPSIDPFSTKEFSILEYIDRHSSDHLSVERLAEKCGMCYSNFAKQFKTQYGKTCKEYIEFIRVCKADSMLLYTDKTLDFISQETGFTDASHFIRTYKKIRGITPKQRRATK